MTDQIDKFLKNIFNLELVFKNAGRTKIKIAMRDIAGTISSIVIFNSSRNF
tara:strand:- start:38 stop:190 length:153 start_codon:yes stop_codon:yes gene_type:complete